MTRVLGLHSFLLLNAVCALCVQSNRPITQSDDDSITISRAIRARPTRSRENGIGEKPDHLDEGTFRMIVDDTNIPDPVNATDEKVLQAYEARGSRYCAAANSLHDLTNSARYTRPRYGNG